MRILFIAIFTTLIFISCGKKEIQTEQTQKKVEPYVESKSTGSESKKESSGETKSSGGLEDVNFDISVEQSRAKYDGEIVSGVKWKDKNGNNLIIISETKISEKKGKRDEPDVISKQLYAYQYIDNAGEWKQLWKVNDFINDCPLDLQLQFMKNSLTVTDIDNNGIGESTFIYRLSCRGDVGPSDMKLIMHEGEKKYAIRGTTKMIIPNMESMGGETNVDKSFDDAPDGFLKYAKEQWKKYIEEKFAQ